MVFLACHATVTWSPYYNHIVATTLLHGFLFLYIFVLLYFAFLYILHARTYLFCRREHTTSINKTKEEKGQRPHQLYIDTNRVDSDIQNKKKWTLRLIQDITTYYIPLSKRKRVIFIHLLQTISTCIYKGHTVAYYFFSPSKLSQNFLFLVATSFMLLKCRKWPVIKIKI